MLTPLAASARHTTPYHVRSSRRHSLVHSDARCWRIARAQSCSVRTRLQLHRLLLSATSHRHHNHHHHQPRNFREVYGSHVLSLRSNLLLPSCKPRADVAMVPAAIVVKRSMDGIAVTLHATVGRGVALFCLFVFNNITLSRGSYSRTSIVPLH